MENEEKKIIIEKALILVKDAISKGVSKYRIANDTSINETTIGNYANGKNNPSFANAKILLDYFNSFAIMDNGSSIIVENNIIDNIEKEESDLDEDEAVENILKINFTTGVPYYNVDFIGGFDLVMNDQTTIPEYLIDFKKYNDATCWCNVTGHSMEPEITHGDMIAMKKIEDFSFLPFGEVYAIVTTNGMRTIKRLGKGDDKEHYNLVPTNKSTEYSIQELPKRMISSIFQVLGCMKRL